MISKLLSTAVKLYLRSQLRRVEELQVNIIGKNKQILQGYIPQLLLNCNHAIYQGLHLREVELNGSNIAFNLPEVIKKKPLRLLEPVFVTIKLELDAADLQASLDSDLLQNALSDLWQMVLATQQIDPASLELANLKIEWRKIAIANKELNFRGTYEDASGKGGELYLSIGIALADSHTLCLSLLKITSDFLSFEELENQLKIDLGTDVAIEQLVIKSEQIICAGKIKINN